MKLVYNLINARMYDTLSMLHYSISYTPHYVKSYPKVLLAPELQYNAILKK
jgi:hypothetical protein